MTERYTTIPIDQIQKNPFQPREQFNPKELEELAQSITENGLIQPIIVRESDVFGYELIAGERRLRASQLAGLTSITAIIKTITDEDSMKQAIIENLQRSNLNPIEEAKAYQAMIDKKQLTHDDIARYMGKSRPYVTNSLRLLQLPKDLQTLVEQGQISQGHARLLLSLSENEQIQWAKCILSEELSVHKLQQLLKKKNPTHKKTAVKSSFIKEQERHLQKHFGTAVTIETNRTHQGHIRLPFSSLDDFHRIMDILTFSVEE